MNKINEEVKKFVTEYTTPFYKKNESGHSFSHIDYVVKRSLKFADEIKDINLNMVYTIAMFHDVAHHIDKKTHEILSAKILRECTGLSDYFSKEEIEIMAQAIEDHRASLEHPPRTIYGKIVSTADRNNTVEQCFFRAYSFSRKSNPSYTEDEVFNEAYTHLNKKFGVNGYAKVYLKDEEYENFLIEIRSLLSNKEKFITEHKKYINNLKKEGKI